MDWSEDATAVFADIDAEVNGSHDRTSAQETVAMIFPATVCIPDPPALLNDNENAAVTEKVPTLQLQVPALQLQATALQAAGERQTRIENEIAKIDQVNM